MSGLLRFAAKSSKYLILTAPVNGKSNEKTSARNKLFSRMKKLELEKAIRDANTKLTKMADKACDRCLEQQHKQHLIEKMFLKKCLENAI